MTLDTNSLLRRARAEGTPLIDGETATFVWRGRNPPALVGDFNDWNRARPLSWAESAPGIWTHPLTLPADAYIEYAFLRPGKGGAETRVPDRFNPRTVSNGQGAMQHYFYMPDAAPTPLARRRPGVPRGTVTRHVVNAEPFAASRRRTVHLYRPPSPDPCPLLVVLDGQDYLRRGRLPAIVDNLVAQGRIRPIAMAMVEHGRQARVVEYGGSDITLRLLLDCVLPLARQHLNLLDARARPGAFGILGASMGGIAALYSALRAPEIFGHALSQSGAFSLGAHDLVVYELVRQGAARPIRLWMDVGRYEWLLETNRRMRDLLAAKGCDVTLREYNAGHNYPAWRDEVWRGLEHLFGRTP